ncbi:MAG: flagellar hook-basal body complex protein FliE [Lachnospiraceae bacterium]|nr:flagellar hook-basal body complex protein FliE [Lachnospiraceae bacterium]
MTTFTSIQGMNNALDKINNNTLTSAFDSNLTASDTQESSFDSLLDSAINLIKETDKLSNAAEEEEIKYALGYDNTLELMLAQNKANLSLSYTVAIRDKVVEAYREIMNLQF